MDILRARQRGKRRYVVETVLNFRWDGNLRRIGQLQLGFGSLWQGRAWCWCWRVDGDGFYLWCWGLNGRGCGRWYLGFRFWFGWGGSDGGGVAQAVDRLG